jgi:hypothetical protein
MAEVITYCQGKKHNKLATRTVQKTEATYNSGSYQFKYNLLYVLLEVNNQIPTKPTLTHNTILN